MTCLDEPDVGRRTKNSDRDIRVRRKRGRLAYGTRVVRAEGIVVKDDAGQRTGKLGSGGLGKAIFEKTRQSMALPGPLTATDESTRWSGAVVEDSVILPHGSRDGLGPGHAGKKTVLGEGGLRSGDGRGVAENLGGEDGSPPDLIHSILVGRMVEQLQMVCKYRVLGAAAIRSWVAGARGGFRYVAHGDS